VAQKIQTLFIDDIDGSEAEGTIRFGLDGAEYEIDLSAEHAQELRGALGEACAVAAGGVVVAGERAGERADGGPAGSLSQGQVPHASASAGAG
jgi:hypothetical protein